MTLPCSHSAIRVDRSHGLQGRRLFSVLVLLFLFIWTLTGKAQSRPLTTDRGRVTVASIPDPFGGPKLKVLRTDANTPLRAGTAWIWEKDRKEEPESYYASMRAKGLNAVRMILFDTWEVEAYTPSATFTPTDWNDPAYRTRQLARMERSINYASANGMYVIINSHNKIPNYNAAYNDALWTHVAPFFAARTHVLYEAANEPMDGIGNNGSMTANASDSATTSHRIQALKNTYNIIRKSAPRGSMTTQLAPGSAISPPPSQPCQAKLIGPKHPLPTISTITTLPTERPPRPPIFVIYTPDSRAGLRKTISQLPSPTTHSASPTRGAQPSLTPISTSTKPANDLASGGACGT